MWETRQTGFCVYRVFVPINDGEHLFDEHAVARLPCNVLAYYNTQCEVAADSEGVASGSRSCAVFCVQNVVNVCKAGSTSVLGGIT